MNSQGSDVTVLAGDLNATPGSRVHQLFIDEGFTDSLLDKHGDSSSDAQANCHLDLKYILLQNILVQYLGQC